MDSLLPKICHLIGYGRKPISDAKFTDYIVESTKKHSRRKISESTLNGLEGKIQFQAGEYDNAEDFDKLRHKIEDIEKVLDQPLQCLFYISTPPVFLKPFSKILAQVV